MKTLLLLVLIALPGCGVRDAMLQRALAEGWPIELPKGPRDAAQAFTLPYLQLVGSAENAYDPAATLLGKVRRIEIKQTHYARDESKKQDTVLTQEYGPANRMQSQKWESDSIWFLTTWTYDETGRILLAETKRLDTGEVIVHEKNVYNLTTQIVYTLDAGGQLLRVVTETNSGTRVMYTAYEGKEVLCVGSLEIDPQGQVVTQKDEMHAGAYVSRALRRWTREHGRVVHYEWRDLESGAPVLETR